MNVFCSPAIGESLSELGARFSPFTAAAAAGEESERCRESVECRDMDGRAGEVGSEGGIESVGVIWTLSGRFRRIGGGKGGDWWCRDLERYRRVFGDGGFEPSLQSWTCCATDLRSGCVGGGCEMVDVGDSGESSTDCLGGDREGERMGGGGGGL